MLLLAATLVSAQTFRGTILGTVTDTSGAVVSGATVKVRNQGTGLERTTQTSGDGSYSVPELPIGNLHGDSFAERLSDLRCQNVAVDVAADRRVDVSTQARTGGGEGRGIRRGTAAGGNHQRRIWAAFSPRRPSRIIPVNGRDYTKLIYLNPGVAGSPDQISDSPGSFGEFSMNGSRGRSNNYLLDGTDMNDGYRNDPAINEAGVFGDPATILPIDAIGELHVLSNYEAEYGRNSGAIVNIVTKSGTNQWHGSALEYYRSGALGARNYFNIGSQPKNPFLNNQFGGSLGGPIVKDKAFFFVDYEGQRESGAQAGLSCVPDPNSVAQAKAMAAANGNARASRCSTCWPAIPGRSPNIPGAWPTWTEPATGCPSAPPNLATSTRFLNNVDSLITKIDYNPNSNNNITGRYYYGNSNQSFPFAQLAGGLLPGFNTVTPTRVQLVALIVGEGRQLGPGE